VQTFFIRSCFETLPEVVVEKVYGISLIDRLLMVLKVLNVYDLL